MDNNKDIIHFTLNNWMVGKDYPPGEPFETWMSFYTLTHNNWCREQKICVYYGNIDKVITAVTGKYPIYYGWSISITDDEAQLPNISQLSEDAMDTHWWDYWYYNDDEYYTGTDPVSMKYKSSPHAVYL